MAASDLYDQPSRLAARPETISLYPDIIGQSSELQQTMRLVARVAPTNSTVLLLGETEPEKSWWPGPSTTTLRARPSDDQGELRHAAGYAY
jgi:hypothetical protein